MKAIFFTAALFFSVSLFAQYDRDGLSFGKGAVVVNGGYNGLSVIKAFLKLGSTDLYTGGTYKTSDMGPVGGGFEIGVNEWLGLGLQGNYSTLKGTYDDGAGYRYTETFVTSRYLIKANIHFATTDKLDPYIGIGGGYNKSKYTFTDNDNDPYNDEQYDLPFPVAVTAGIGLRYYPVRNFGFYAEAGYLTGSLVQGGIVLRF